MEDLYPKGPQHIIVDFTKPSPLFRNRIKRVSAALVFFAVVYLLLLLAGIALAVVLAVCGGVVMFYIHNIFVIAFGAGLIVAGGMVLYFLVKFVFETKKDAQSRHLEITETEYPRLFEFIRHLSKETGTDFPKHIYISPEVNAAVFYDSNVRSMFFPVKKNLLIGLGLVNMVNISEFKAVLAHEFGHFSQKSMRAGSYVYQVNRAIYNMLYENDNYGQILNRWANIHRAFAICANITIGIVRGIQAVQRQAYKIVNKQYSLLSQQMEFHADAIAAKAAGSNNIIHALRRIEFGDDCYNAVIQKYNEWVPDGLKGDNLYAHQRIVAASLASAFRLPVRNGLPLLNDGERNYKSDPRVSIDDQWASHPTLHQREDALNKINVVGEVIEESAWALFGDSRNIQEKLTSDLYTNVKFKVKTEIASEKLFADAFELATKENSFPAIYDLYFRNRGISGFDPDTIPDRPDGIQNIDRFFAENASLNAKRVALEGDLNLLEHIAKNPKHFTSFNFDGDKFRSRDAETISATLKNELKQLRETLLENDESVYLFFLHRAMAVSEEAKNSIKNYYRYYFRLQELTDGNIAFCNHFLALIKPCVDKSYSVENNTRMAGDVEQATGLFKSRLTKIEDFFNEPSQVYKYVLPAKVAGTRSKQLTYIEDGWFIQEQLKDMFDCIHEFGAWNFAISFRCQKELLEKQLEYLPQN